MDYYHILGVPRTASDDDIKAAFRRLVLRYHPDRQGGASVSVKAESAQKFKAISEAYDILGDVKKRSEYSSLSSQKYNRAGGTSYRREHYYSDRQYNPFNSQSHAYTSRRPSSGSNFWSILQALARNTTRGDAIFHAGMASAFAATLLVVGTSGNFLWGHHNEGKLFHHMEADIQSRRPSGRSSNTKDESASESGKPEKSKVQEHMRLDDDQYQQVIGVRKPNRIATESQNPNRPVKEEPSLRPENLENKVESLERTSSEINTQSNSKVSGGNESQRSHLEDPRNRPLNDERNSSLSPVHSPALPSTQNKPEQKSQALESENTQENLQNFGPSSNVRKIAIKELQDLRASTHDEQKEKTLGKLAEALGEDSLRNMSERNAESARLAKLEELNKTISDMKE